MDSKLSLLIDDLLAGNRLALARAITILESERLEDQKNIDDILAAIFKNRKTQKTLRIGISGVPGVGKSSLIEKLGLSFIAKGHRVATLAIDPSSEITQGSVLGDKTRMEELSRKEEAFIRPSASRGHLGGIGMGTHDSILLCEAAGYDIVMIETVGVGQSESHVADLVDYFVFLALPGAGDDLQGIKKGILEKVDAVLVNKADGENKLPAQITQKQLSSSLKILRHQDIPVSLVSAYYNTGVEEFVAELMQIWQTRGAQMKTDRLKKETRWVGYYLEQFIRMEVQSRLQSDKDLGTLEQQILDGKLLSRQAARTLLKKFGF
jgi:LAO/AO transport system kinase